ncbi:hypothetical protein VFPPC_17043 [Pochonia chlamydosporia 170]|uniref:Uncharacterized protein n=1 Tax=Pochonia chlamydosporia 170 TaxID=1380566 RepID=A0A179EXY8_METCM|nr:hypothetical protein VFPPC_17043 [Pochonia chlamydosporia 170]OAQ58038.2 hypothetical protein VFPPC_17043 [Pochonia chlamydosporia 170]
MVWGMTVSEISTDTPEPPANGLARRTGYGISPDKRCVTFNEENILWLPIEFRPTCSTVSGSTIAIGCSSGRVIVIELSHRGISDVCSN